MKPTDPPFIPRHDAKRWHDRKDAAGRRTWLQDYGTGLAAAAIACAFALGASGTAFPSLPGAQCQIKGNIAPSGERIFHTPGQRYYHETRISFFRGERWFCSAAEARKAGWRPSRV